MKERPPKIWPRRVANGKYVLYETTYTGQYVRMGWRNIQKSKTRVWPPSKQSNGRGRQFNTRREAMTYYATNKGAN